MISAADLQIVELLRDLPGPQLELLLANGHEIELAPGEYLFREGDPARHFHLLLAGELETTHAVGGDQVFLIRHEPGGFLGATALLTNTPYRGSTRAIAHSRLLAVEPADFRRLVVEEPDLLQTLIRAIPVMMQNLKSIERDREQLIALGGLAAGLAHELNNPAAAAARAAHELGAVDGDLERALAELAPELRPVLELSTTSPSGELDPLEASDRAESLAASLAGIGVSDPHRIAAACVEAGLTGDDLDGLAPTAIAMLAARLEHRRLLHELAESTERISSLIASVKQYSYMDQAPRQEVDVHDGLENTLTILSHKLKQGSIMLDSDFDRSLPRIDACGSELNQVWTNLIDNAIHAAGERGRIGLRTYREMDSMVVEVVDSGAGIPEDVRGRIFDPFFTTKPPGEGTGIGLDIAHRIVVKHHGEIRVETGPDGTSFRVYLPLEG